MAEAREVPAKPFLSTLGRGDRGRSSIGKWFAANGATLLLLFFIFFLALFVRSYFGYELTTDNGYIWSGGSDSYYWGRILDYSAETGKQLYWDPLINYPDGIRNPRPPFFSFSIVVPAMIIQDLFSSLDESVLWTFMWSTAFWGALTVVPTYFLGKETFGRRAGLAAAFFLALMPSHVQRSVLSDADHDSFILFFIVLTFYFLMKAVKTQDHRKWVENWKSMSSIWKGLGDYVRNSRTPILYAALAGVSYGSVIMAWVGFGYVTVLILAYYVIQLLLNKFRNADSFSVTAIVFITMGLGYLLSFPVYYEQSLIVVRFDVPVYLFVAAMFFGIMFVVSRDYPWTLTLPAVFIVLGAAIVIIDVFNPALADAILSGQGYFVKSKLYSTIAEARAPRFSELALSFGMVTFFLSLIGMIWALVKVPKHATSEYIFIVVWMAAAIFMAISAGRFMFNAAPAFAVAAGWVLVIIVDRLDFNSVRKSLTGASGSYWHIFKKSVKLRHVVGALFLAFMVVLPNVWYAVDAGIPSETKAMMDKEIYFSMPDIIRPSGYDEINGSVWYLGAFGYSLPLPKYYFPAAWEWFAKQDANILPESQRPAYVSWWDYGFEAIQAGRHPTVADNFQNGYQLTGNVLMAQSEGEAIAIFAYRLFQSAMYDGPDAQAKLLAVLDKYGVDSHRMRDTVLGPGKPFVNEVLSDPTVYGPMASDLSEANARIVVARVELMKLPLETLVELYDEICDVTGYSIRYFNVDSRIFPKSGTDTGIFYAPAKLSDRRIVRGSTPIDFYDVKAVDNLGQEHDLEDITSDMTITDYTLAYTNMFYDSMFYRAMVGYSGSDVGSANDGVPGLSGSLSSKQALPAWNLTHFRMVYRTAYFNPFPVDQLAYHRDAWRAVSVEEGIALKQKIDAGEIEGYVDMSSSSYYSSGTVFLKFYLGAYVNGTLTTEEGLPVAGMRVTVQDEYGIPHQTSLTDASGHYAVLAPFGNVTVIFSQGNATNDQLTGSNIVTRIQFNVTDDQAMRKPTDMDSDGILDYIIMKDYVMRGTDVEGKIFWDIDLDGNYTEGTDEFVQGAEIFVKDLVTGLSDSVDATGGTFTTRLAPGTYSFNALVSGLNLTMAEEFNISAGTKATPQISIKPSGLSGFLLWKNGTRAEGVELVLTSSETGLAHYGATDSNGNFSFEKLVAGQYALTANLSEEMLFEFYVGLEGGQTLVRNGTLEPVSTIEGQVFLGSAPVPHASYVLFNSHRPELSVAGTTDSEGKFSVEVPKGEWSLYASHYASSGAYSGVALFDTFLVDEDFGPVYLSKSSSIRGSIRMEPYSGLDNEFLVFESSDGARIPVKTGTSGNFDIRLPMGAYDVTCFSLSEGAIYYGQMTVDEESELLLPVASEGALVRGTVFLDKDAVSGAQEEDAGMQAELSYTTPDGTRFTAAAYADGTFSLVYPKVTDITVRLDVPGYREWSREESYGGDIENLRWVALPDDVVVSGRLTSEGSGVMSVTVGFLPDSFLLDAVYATTGPGGYYSALVPPGEYTCVVDENTTLMGGEKYLFEEELSVLPSGVSLAQDVAVSKKIEMRGVIPGSSREISLKLSGPEEVSLTLSTSEYTAYVLPGTYRVYATSTVGANRYANISAVAVSFDSRQHDFSLVRAYDVSGTITIGGTETKKPTTVTATASTGEQVKVTSTSLGRFTLDLPPGTYTMSYVLEDLRTEGSQQLFVEYTATETLSVVDSDVLLGPTLAERLDNTTISGMVFGPNGLPVEAVIELVANTAYGMTSSFSTSAGGSFSVEVQPGDYTVFATRLQEKSASISTIALTRNEPFDMRVDLKRASFVTGTASIGGTGTALDMTLTGGNSRLKLSSGPDGYFEKLLPPSDYTLSGFSWRIENGVNVTYSSSTSFVIGDNDVRVAFDLLRDTKRSVATAWDRNLTQTAAPGVAVTYSFTVRNTGNIEDTYLVTFTGSGFSVKFTPSEVKVNYGASNMATVIAEVTPLNTTAAGDTKVSCLVRSSSLASVRSDLSLYVKVAPVRGVNVTSLDESKPVAAKQTVTTFQVNNTGNADDDIIVRISNTEALEALGWSAQIVDLETGEPVANVSLGAFTGTQLAVNFTAIRSSPDPTAEALVYAYSANASGSSAYGSVPILLPDLVIAPGYLGAVRSDVRYSLDMGNTYLDIGLVAALAVLILVFFLLRKKKGLGGGAKK